jgi:hypothetical protein
LLMEYAEHMDLIEVCWPEVVANFFKKITSDAERKEHFLLMASDEDCPEPWKAAYYLLTDLNKPFEEVFAEWEEAKAQLDLPHSDPTVESFMGQALEQSLPRTLQMLSNRSEVSEEGNDQQKNMELSWSILCDADWKIWAPLAKEYYLGLVLGSKKSDFARAKVALFEKVDLSPEGHIRLLKILVGTTNPGSEEEFDGLQNLLGYQLPIDQLSALIEEAALRLANNQASSLKDFMKRSVAFFFQNNIRPSFRKQLWLHLATVLLYHNNEKGFQLLMREKLLENWQGVLPKGLQSFFQQTAMERKMQVAVVLQLYEMMGKTPFNSEETTKSALEFIKKLILNISLPIGSFKRVMELIFGVGSPFNQSIVEEMSADLFKVCTENVGNFVPQSKEEMIQLLCSLEDKNLQRHFKGFYTLMKSLYGRFKMDETASIDKLLHDFQLKIQKELHYVIPRMQTIPLEQRKMFCPNGEPFAQQVIKRYMEALLTGKDS